MRRIPVAVCLVAALAACPKGKDDPARTLSRVEVTPPAPTLPAGTGVSLHATAVYSDGATADVTDAASWSTSSAAVLSVSNVLGSKGVASALAAGSATVTATFEGVSGTAAATVVVKTPVSVTVAPSSVSVPAGQETTLTATATFDDLSTFDVTASATWTSGDPAVVVSDAAGTKGRVHAEREGWATISASFGGKFGTALVTVTPAVLEAIRVEPLDPGIAEGGGVTLRAFAVFSDATEQDVSAASAWTAAPTGVVSLTASGGAMQATGLAAGTAVVTATYQARTDSVTVTVRPAVLRSIAVAPVSRATVVGGTVQLLATGTYDDGRVADVTALATWSATPAGVASVSNDAGTRGRVTGLAFGTASVTATIGTVASDPVTVQVRDLVVAALRLEPDVVTVAPAHAIPVRAFGVDASGAEADVTAVATWTTSASSVATVSGGVVSGIAVGSATLTATRGGVSATAGVKVEAPYPVRLIIATGGEETAGVGAEGQLRAIAVYSDAQRRDVTPLAAWISDDTAVVSVSDAPGTKGAVRCVAVGTAHVSASLSGLAATVTFTVTPRRALWINVSGAPAPLPVGMAHPFRAEAVYDDWTSEDVTAVATWSGNGIVTVAPGGVATTVSAGGGIVTATWAGVTGSSLLTVTAEAPTSMTVSLGRNPITQGDSTTFTAWLYYPSGIRYDVSAFATITSDAPAVAEIVVDRYYQRPLPYGVAPGTAVLTIAYGGFTQTATLTVAAPTSAMQVIVPATLPAGVIVYARAWVSYADVGEEAQWTSSDPAVVTVAKDAAQYVLVTAIAPGTAVLTATYGTRTASATITVRSRALVVRIAPAFAQLVESDPPGVGPQQAFTAAATLADGTTMDVTAISRWTIGDPAVLRFTGMTPGVVSSAARGTSTVTATVGAAVPGALGAASGSALVEVTADHHVAGFDPPGPYRLPPGVTVPMRLLGDPPRFLVPPNDLVAWSSSDSSVATFSTVAGHEGELTTVGYGTATLSASFGGRTVTTTLVVDVLDHLVATPPSLALAAAGTGSVNVEAVFACAPTPCVAPTFIITRYLQPWTTTDATVASATLGTAFGGRIGSATLTAHFAGKSIDVPVLVGVPGVETVTVAAPPADGYFVGTHRPVRATATLTNGELVDVTSLATWSESTGGTIATLTGTPPVIDALVAGAGTLSADYGGVVGTAPFTVVDTSPAGLDFNPANVTLPVNAILPVSVRQLFTTYPGGHVGSEAVLSSSDPAIASISHGTNSALVRANGVGTAVLSADYRGLRAYAVVNVVAASAAGPIALTAASAYGVRLRPYERRSLSATASLTGAYVTAAAAWTSSDPLVAQVVSPGLVAAVVPGTATITASMGAWSASTEVTVLPASLVMLEMSEFAVALPAGATSSLRVLGRYSDDGAADLTYAVAWSTQDALIADFDPATPGFLRANGAGITYVEARFDGRAARIPVTVF
jgi:uncharacterized protein YjdB